MITHPTARFMLGHPARIIALGFGTGLAPVAPGTVGTALAFPIFILLDWWLDPLSAYDPRAKAAAIFGVIVVFFAIGVWACGRTGRDLGVADHSGMNWDEVVSMLLVLMFIRDDWRWWLFAFFTFRFFDVLKPPPIRDIDRRMKGGLGVMFDDIVAASYTLFVIAIVTRVLF